MELDHLPNIVLIHTHDLGYQLGCYGRSVETPHIDALADSGVLFKRHYATAPQCSPSRSSLWTGTYPHQNGLMGLAHGNWSLDEAYATLPEQLTEQAGYETHLFGLQHVTDDPQSVGFEYVHSEGNLLPAASPKIHEVNRATDVAETLSIFLEKESYHEPFFASVGVFELHRIEVNDHFGFNDGRYTDADPETVSIPPYLPDKPGIRNDVAEMVGMLESLDAGVATMLEAIESAGLTEETLVIFTTEHGIAFPRAKGCCYDPGIEVALLLRLPGYIDGGRRFDELLSNVDIMPTLLDLVGVEIPDTVVGRSFLPLLSEDQYIPREQIFAEMTWHDRYNPVRAVRTEEYKYVRNFWHLPAVYLSNDVFVSEAGREVRVPYHADHREYEELYDLTDDPDEQSNLAASQDYEAVRRTLENELVDWMRRTDDPLLKGPVLPADYEAIIPWLDDDTG